MIFEIDKIPIFFPYENIYPEQLKYIKSMIKTLQSAGHCLIEMPSGTGKTISLLSSTVSYLIHAKSKGISFKIVYCSRTVPEIDKTLKELKNLISFIEKHATVDFLGLGLSKRANMCVNDEALRSFDIDLMCKKMVNNIDGLKCDFFDNTNYNVKPGVYDFDDLKDLGKSKGICPYYFVRNTLSKCDCVIYTYNYLIDPSIYSIISKDLPKDSFVIFDEAHNIDSHCIESLSMEINRNILEAASRVLNKLDIISKDKRKDFHTIVSNAIEETKKIDDIRFKTNKKVDYNINGTIPYFYTSNIYEYTPGNLRNSRHFISVLKRLIEFYKTKLKTSHLTTESISSFIQSIYDLTFIDKKTLQFCSQRLGMLIQYLQFEDDEMFKLNRVADFSTMLSLYSKGFSIIFEPYDTMSSVFNPVLRLCCLDSSIAIQHVFKRFRNVIITSGTLSPIDMYPKILNFIPTHVFEIGATLDRNSICPLIITKGNDQMLLRVKDDNESIYLEGLSCDNHLKALEHTDHKSNNLTTSFSLRTDPSVTRNYGNLIISFSKITPDNIVCFFPSYIYMEEIITIWSETGIIKEILQEKLIFIETPDSRETSIALSNYKNACDNGRGAILFSVARGKVSEGVDFEHGYGRAVVMLGVPFMYTESARLKERLQYMKIEYNIREYDFLVFDAMRHAAQCLGRILRNKSDYGLMIMADQRFGLQNKLEKMPKWIQEYVEKGNSGLSIDMAVNIAKSFFKEMAQKVEGIGHSLLSESDVKIFLNK